MRGEGVGPGRILVVLLTFLVLVQPPSPAAAPAPVPAPDGTLPAAVPARDARSVLYMNKTPAGPIIDSTWTALEWTRLKRYDVSWGSGQCIMYIGFDAQRLYIGLDVMNDATNDANVGNADYLEIGMDGDDDGVVTHVNPTGNETGVVWPRTMGGPCLDRWAQIFGHNNNLAGWINLDATNNYRPQLWYTQGGYENTDRMSAIFSGHRYYEYSIEFNREMGLTAGVSNIFGLDLAAYDASAGLSRRGWFPSNFSGIGGPFGRFALAQAPEARIRLPTPDQVIYEDEDVLLDGSDSTDDETSTLVYNWSFDDGGTAEGRTASHRFATTGRHVVKLKVTDRDALESETQTTVVIKERNVPPTLVDFSPARDPVINETEDISFTINATDPNLDVGDILFINWSIDGKPKQSRAGVRDTFTVSTDYDPGAKLAAGTYLVRISIQDLYDGGWDSPVVHGWNLTVVDRNRPPLLDSFSPEADTLSTDEVTPVPFSMTKSDPDRDPLSVQWSLDNTTQTGARDRDNYVYEPDYNSSGTHVVKVIVTDKASARAERAWTVLVGNVNRAPRIDSSTPSSTGVSVKEGKEVLLQVRASDPDGEPLRLSWYIGEYQVEGANGTFFTFRPPHEGDLSSQFSPYTVRAVARDGGGLTAERSWEVSVEEVDRPPVAVVDEPAESSEFRQGAQVRFKATSSSDPDTADNASLSFLWDFADGKTAKGSTVSHVFSKAGSYWVVLKVTSRGLTSTTNVNVTVRAPVLRLEGLNLTPEGRLTEGKEVTVTVRVRNDGDAEAVNAKVQLSIDGAPLTTLYIKTIDIGASGEASYLWFSVKGAHQLLAELVASADSIILEGASISRALTVRARPSAGGGGFPTAAAAGAGAAILVGILLAWVVLSRRARRRAQAPSRGAPASMAEAAAPAGPLPGPSAVPEAGAPPAPAGTAAGATPAGEPAAGPPVIGPSKAPAPAPAPAGTAPAPAAPGAPLCPLCDEPVEADWAKCPVCGTALGAQTPAPAPPGEAPPVAAPAGEAPGPAPEGPPVEAPPPSGAGAAPAALSRPCASCGAQLEAGWRVCPECGTSAGEQIPAGAGGPAPEDTAPAQKPRCPACGEEVEAAWSACPFCEAKLG